MHALELVDYRNGVLGSRGDVSSRDPIPGQMTGKLRRSTTSRSLPSLAPLSPQGLLCLDKKGTPVTFTRQIMPPRLHKFLKSQRIKGSRPLPLNSILSREEKACNYVCSGYKLLSVVRLGSGVCVCIGKV